MGPVKPLAIILMIFGVFSSCGKIEKLPPEPYIRFISFEVYDTIDILGNDSKAGRLKFYFEDGDGDLGLKSPGTTSETDTTNLFLTLFRKKGGVLVPTGNLDPLKPSSYRIPFMERLGQNKILKGTISVTFLYLFYAPSDTIIYEFFIKDRAEYISNTVRTCEIALNINGTCVANGITP